MQYKKNKKIKENKGFTLVEVLIAVIILAIVSVTAVQGVSMVRKTYASNMIKTEAVAIANREIEIIRAMVFTDIGIKNGDPVGILDPQTTFNSFTVTRSVSWSSGSSNNVKQVKIVVSNPLLLNSVKVITEIIPSIMSIADATTTTVPATTTTVPATTTTVPATTTTVPATTTTVPATTTSTILVKFPAPTNLIVVSDIIRHNNHKRTVIISWQKPPSLPPGTTYGIKIYNIYRGIIIIATVVPPTLTFTDIGFPKDDNSAYTYSVTAMYTDPHETESAKSNLVTTVPIIQ